MRMKIAAAVAALGVMASPALADRKGIAFVQAPEVASGSCTGPNKEAAFDCARKQCIEGGGTAEDCIETAYCFPAFWSVEISFQNKDGFSWSQAHCGFGSKEDALAAAKALCDLETHPDLSQCQPYSVTDEDVNVTSLDQ